MSRVVRLDPEPLGPGLRLVVHDLHAAVHLPVGPHHHLPASWPGALALRTFIVTPRLPQSKEPLQITIGLKYRESYLNF